jgi:hypothetical protein
MAVLIGDNTMKLMSTKPEFNDDRKSWQLRFDGPVMKSNKNAILNREKIRAVMVRKTSKNGLEVDMFDQFQPEVGLLIGIGSWLCPL